MQINTSSEIWLAVHYDDLMECGSMTAAKEKGLVRSEGKAVHVVDKRKLY